MTPDCIKVRGLKLETRVGVTEEERAQLREVTIDLEIAADLEAAGRSDSLADTVDYSRVIDRVEQLTSSGEFMLLESMAEQIAEAIFTFERVGGVTVEVAKHPPIAQEVEAVAVRINRQ